MHIHKLLSRIFTATLFAIAALGRAKAEVTLPSILASHMVLQRSEPVHIWGWAAPAEEVHVSFRGESRIVIADSLEDWEVYFSPGEAGGPFSLTIQGSNTITLDDILVGDVWIASGQSNMEMPMSGFGPTMPIKDSANEIAHADNPHIRLLRLARNSSDYPLDDAKLAAGWEQCTPQTVAGFSAAGYFFARDLQRSQKVPIGVIDTTWGGTPVEAWTSLDTLSSDRNLMPVFTIYDELASDHSTDLRKSELEKTEDAQLKAAGKTPPQRPSHHQLPMWQPAGLFNGMVAPLSRLRLKGVIWYQGESNADSLQRAALYEASFAALIRDWRKQWDQGDFPFLFVQLSAYGPSNGSLWPVVREAQRRVLELKNTAMAVSIDIGEAHNIHPADKQDVGSRLALAARAIAYGERIEYSGPFFREAVRDGDSIHIWFDHARGLHAKEGSAAGLEIAGADRKFFPATGTITGETIVVRSEKVPSPVYVRYAWAGSPEANLYNDSDLPASPFTSDRDFRANP